MTTPDTAPLSMTCDRTIAAPPRAVFDAWLDPSMLARFMTPGAGMSVPRAETDPRVGGRFEIDMQGAEDLIPHAGTYKEISPHERIVFTWESPYSRDDSEVTLELRPEGGGTHITLTHVRFVNEEMRDNHLGGWTAILAALSATLETEGAA